MKLLVIISAIIYSVAAVTIDFEDGFGSFGIMTKDCNGTGSASISTATAHGGKSSLLIQGDSGFCNHVWVGMAISPIPTMYVRFWVNHNTLLPDAHIGFIAMKDENDGGKDLRIGGQNKALEWNRESDDATLPSQSPQGIAQSVPLPTNKWVCVEIMISQSGTGETWVDGVSIPGLKIGGKVQDIDQGWLNKAWRPSLTDIRFGWESYGGGADTLYYDDIVIGNTKAGC